MSPRPPFPPPARGKSKHRLFIGVMLAVVLSGGAVSFLMSGGKSARKAAPKQEIVTITLPPPPPPPPPPPKIEPPKTEPPPEDKQEELVEQPPEVEPPPEAPADPPSEVLGTTIPGDGPGLAGLGSSGNGGGNRNSIGGGASQQARIDWYAKKILVTTIKEALERNPSTRHIVMEDGIRVWIDKDGRITRVRLLGGAAGAAALEQVLIGLRTAQTPPTGMPASIDFKIKARKPAAS